MGAMLYSGRSPASGWRGGTPDRETGAVRWDPGDGALCMAFAEADWTLFRSLHLDLSSQRAAPPSASCWKSWTRTEDCLGSTTFCVDWAGREPDAAVAGQHGTPRSARPVGGGGRHPSVTPQGGPVADGARGQAT